MSSTYIDMFIYIRTYLRYIYDFSKKNLINIFQEPYFPKTTYIVYLDRTVCFASSNIPNITFPLRVCFAVDVLVLRCLTNMIYDEHINIIAHMNYTSKAPASYIAKR